ncbi:hypothetical protein AB0H69_16255 [Streptomyces phaeochromogenes]
MGEQVELLAGAAYVVLGLDEPGLGKGDPVLLPHDPVACLRVFP